MADQSGNSIGVFFSQPSNPVAYRSWHLASDGVIYVWNGSAWVTTVSLVPIGVFPYDVAGTVIGQPDDGGVVLRYPFPRAVRFLAGLPLSRAVANVAATSSSVFSLKKNGAAAFGTFTFASSGTVATFAAATDTDFTTSDVLTVVAPSPQDATLADIGFGLAGIR